LVKSAFFFLPNTSLSVRYCILEEALKNTGAYMVVAELQNKFKEKERSCIRLALLGLQVLR
jgi:hypothetical protein